MTPFRDGADAVSKLRSAMLDVHDAKDELVGMLGREIAFAVEHGVDSDGSPAAGSANSTRRLVTKLYHEFCGTEPPERETLLWFLLACGRAVATTVRRNAASTAVDGPRKEVQACGSPFQRLAEEAGLAGLRSNRRRAADAADRFLVWEAGEPGVESEMYLLAAYAGRSEAEIADLFDTPCDEVVRIVTEVAARFFPATERPSLWTEVFRRPGMTTVWGEGERASGAVTVIEVDCSKDAGLPCGDAVVAQHAALDISLRVMRCEDFFQRVEVASAGVWDATNPRLIDSAGLRHPYDVARAQAWAEVVVLPVAKDGLAVFGEAMCRGFRSAGLKHQAGSLRREGDAVVRDAAVETRRSTGLSDPNPRRQSGSIRPRTGGSGSHACRCNLSHGAPPRGRSDLTTDAGCATRRSTQGCGGVEMTDGGKELSWRDLVRPCPRYHAVMSTLKDLYRETRDSGASDAVSEADFVGLLRHVNRSLWRAGMTQPFVQDARDPLVIAAVQTQVA